MWKRSVIMWMCAAALTAQSTKYGVGQPATAEQIRNLGAAIAPDGSGLPEGSGTVAAGREVFAARCASCHGEKGEGGVGPRLVGGQGTLRTAKPLKTVGSFWPYATTVWDYTNRAMPFNQPGLLKPPEVYAVVVDLRYPAGVKSLARYVDAICRPYQVMDAKSLP